VVADCVLDAQVIILDFLLAIRTYGHYPGYKRCRMITRPCFEYSRLAWGEGEE
jgi:hypothetical protein